MNNYIEQVKQKNSSTERELERIKKREKEQEHLINLLTLDNLQPYIKLLEEKEFTFDSSLKGDRPFYVNSEVTDLEKYDLCFYKKYGITNSFSDYFNITIYLQPNGLVILGICTEASEKYRPFFHGDVHKLENPSIEELESKIEELSSLKTILIYPKVTKFEVPAHLTEDECRSFLDSWFFNHGLWHINMPNWADGKEKPEDAIILKDALTSEDAKKILESSPVFENNGNCI